MYKKKGQTWSLETYLAIGIFLIGLIFFYGIITVSNLKTSVTVEVEEIGRALLSTDELADGRLTEEELQFFIGLNCTELKLLLNTNQEVCIYIKDSEGNLIENGSHVIHGVGCPGINISGLLCGSVNKTS